MNIVQSKKMGRWLPGKLVNVTVCLPDLLLRFLHLKGWPSRLKVKKDKQTKRVIDAQDR